MTSEAFISATPVLPDDAAPFGGDGVDLPQSGEGGGAHRPELEAFHDRKLVFEHRPGGSRLVSDGAILPADALPPRLPEWMRRLRPVAPRPRRRRARRLLRDSP